jgi:hypothetical protein
MTTIILITLASFLALIDKFDLGWILVKAVELDSRYYWIFIAFALIFRVGLFI